ncbi:hypothetical protein [Peribacillus sp. NPDC097295]|uniref:hypothetical protein n=1 Tax=Peribacillus sp. NPDC097295 TaxID=3364402 RepID=UPI0037FAFD74
MRILQLMILVIFTPIIVFDHFPDLSLARAIPEGILLWLFLVIYLISFSFKGLNDMNLKADLQWQVYSLIYLLSLLAFLTILGGQSSSGIGFDNPFLWLILLMSCLDIYSGWRKLKREIKGGAA